MKNVFTKGEGVKMNSNLDFGDITDIINEFQYLMETTETIWDAEFKYFYRITDDRYIQFAQALEGNDLTIVAQYKLKFRNLKDNIIFIVRQNIEAHYLYQGFPTFKKSNIIAKEEFDDIIQEIADEKNAVSEQALSNETALIRFLKEKGLNPAPSGNNPNSWVANCPSGGQHFIMVVTTDDKWGCGYCRRNGGLEELEQWLQEIKVKKDQKNLSRMMKELEEFGEIRSQDLPRWWMDRY